MKQKLTILIGLLLAALDMQAQAEPEYQLELGAGMAFTTYQGDLNGSLTKGMQPMGAVVAKSKLNPRMAWGLTIGYGQLKGSTADSDSWMPELTEKPASFKTSMADLNLRFEYNFWPYGTGREYFGAQPLTPFIAVGLGFTLAHAKVTQPLGDNHKENSLGAQMPIGLGVKYKVAKRLNLIAEWVMHFTGTDKLDGLEDVYGIKRQGLFKNTDCFSVVQLSLTYDFMEKCRTCHNDKD